MIAYNADQLAAEKPSALADFFDLKRFPGARGLRNSPVVNLEWALMADGVPVDQVYQVLSTDSGVNRAFKVLDRIKKNIVWWDDPLQPLELLRNRKVVMTSAYSGGILDAIKKRNEDLAIVWDGQVWDMVVWVIPKGTVNLKEALDFIVFASDPKRMAVQANTSRMRLFVSLRWLSSTIVSENTFRLQRRMLAMSSESIINGGSPIRKR